MEYTLIRSNRKTVAIQIKGSSLIVRAPMKLSEKQIDEFVNLRRDWIEKHLDKNEEKVQPFTKDELDALVKKATDYFPKRAEYYAEMLGVSFNRITVRLQHTRWGSCSGKGNLNFNALLMLTPPETIDSVVVHELCHLLEMNHSKRFYAHVLRVYPDYYKHHNWLKVGGRLLMHRLENMKK